MLEAIRAARLYKYSLILLIYTKYKKQTENVITTNLLEES